MIEKSLTSTEHIIKGATKRSLPWQTIATIPLFWITLDQNAYDDGSYNSHPFVQIMIVVQSGDYMRIKNLYLRWISYGFMTT